jgi:hypothetical protein
MSTRQPVTLATARVTASSGSSAQSLPRTVTRAVRPVGDGEPVVERSHMEDHERGYNRLRLGPRLRIGASRTRTHHLSLPGSCLHRCNRPVSHHDATPLTSEKLVHHLWGRNPKLSCVWPATLRALASVTRRRTPATRLPPVGSHLVITVSGSSWVPARQRLERHIHSAKRRRFRSVPVRTRPLEWSQHPAAG